jgi:TatD DNase family protein
VKKEKWEAGAMVKGRNEPATIPHVAHVVAGVKGIPVEELCEA